MKHSHDPNNSTHPIIDGVSDGAIGYFLHQFTQTNHAYNCIYIARDDKRMAQAVRSFAFFNPTIDILEFPAWDCLPYDRVSPSSDLCSKRIQTLCKLANWPKDKPYLLATTVNAASQRIPPINSLLQSMRNIAVGTTLDSDDLCKFLVENGYIRVPTVHEPGEFAVRGSIIDIATSHHQYGYRIDLFGNDVESIRHMDLLSQRSLPSSEQTLALLPTSEMILNHKTCQHFKQSYRQNFHVLTNMDDPIYNSVSQGHHYIGMEHWLPLLYPSMDNILDHVSDATIVLDHLSNEAFQERHHTINEYYQARIDNEKSSTKEDTIYHPLAPEYLYLKNTEWNEQFNQHNTVQLSPFDHPDSSNTSFHFPTTNNLQAESNVNRTNVFEQFKKLLLASPDTSFIIACSSEGVRQRLHTILSEHDIPSSRPDSWQDTLNHHDKGIAYLVLMEIETGFKTQNITLFSDQDLLGPKLKTRTSRSRKTDQFFQDYNQINEGELVVHKDHGIGKFISLETLEVDGNQHDCLLLMYHGDDKLYLPVENIALLSRYGSEDGLAKLDKLGASNWQERKARLKKRIRDIAQSLLDVAAKRKTESAPVLESIAGMYDEFCARFEFTETEDQQACIEDVIADLASGKPMDRLICGDVGFGKTEVALRAAFTVVANDSQQQVAVVAPTTLLARQHYQTFKKRFSGFPFEVRSLSRLTPSSDAKRTKQDLKDGKVDIVVGTHSLLAKSIEFNKLGLVIVDEEQLFGVSQKERLKQLQHNTHLLTLSATPIPRTLQMSLTGIKELSLIATPPVDRLAIRSYIMPFDEVVIRNALLREHYRKGKSFVVVPRIKDMEDMIDTIKRIAPELTYVSAHGQMPPTMLEDTISSFYDGKYDILIATNIIGSGLDLPEANTIIIHRADMFGLSQLYQMRGRVGRSKVRAYAYFTTKPRKPLNPIALKRLEIMQSLDSLGAGFTLASHDMDLRGYGNLLGEEQSGHIKEVGIELYQNLLKEAIEQQSQSQEQQLTASWSAHINLGISILLPDDYIKDIELRLSLYRRIGNLATKDEIDDIAEEMADRFGPLPQEVTNLLDVMALKIQCKTVGVERIDAGPKGIVVNFHQNQCNNPDALIDYITRNPTTTKLRADQSIVILNACDHPQDRLGVIQKSLNTLEQILT